MAKAATDITTKATSAVRFIFMIKVTAKIINVRNNLGSSIVTTLCLIYQKIFDAEWNDSSNCCT